MYSLKTALKARHKHVQKVTLLKKSGLDSSSILSTVCFSLGRAINATTKNG
jgi:hypothetical protein